jgi:hypothetical protein
MMPRQGSLSIERDGRAYRDVAEARGQISVFIEDVYNRQRLHSVRIPAKLNTQIVAS